MLVDIGADVNVGGGRGSEGGEEEEVRERAKEQVGSGKELTPICLAVHSRMISMVELLLDLGVSNVHAALKISRELELDDIMGILLKNIALDRNGGTVNLSGLELHTIKPQWILPCLGVSEMLRHNRLHRHSFDRIKDLLMRRKSVGCIEDTALESLRAKMEAKKVSQLEEGTCNEEETDSGVLNGSQSCPGHRRSKSGNISFTPSEKDCVHATRESSSSPPHARLPSGDSSKSHSPVETEGMTEQNALPLSPEVNSSQCNQQLPLSSTPRKSRRVGVTSRGAGTTAFQPTLPPIHCTPASSLKRLEVPLKWVQEEMESSEEVLDSPTSPLVPVPPGEIVEERGGGEDSRGTLVTSMDSGNLDAPHPSTPQRRHHNKLSSLMSPKGAKQNKLHPTGSQGNHSFAELHVYQSSSKQKFASVSLALLLRRLSMWGKDRRQRKLSHASSSTFSHPISPPARIYTDFTLHSFSEDSQESTPVPTEAGSGPHRGRVSSDDGVWTGPPAAIHMPLSASTRSSVLSQMSDSTDGEGVFSPVNSTTVGSFSHHLRRKPSSSSSSRLDDKHSTVKETSFISWNYDTCLSEERREKITAARLVRVLDLSSNSLSGLETMVGVENQEESGGRGEMVLRRLKGLHRLDLKQNHLCRLPRVLMRELKKLSVLNLSCNLFDQLPTESVLSPALTWLDLSSNRVGGTEDFSCSL